MPGKCYPACKESPVLPACRHTGSQEGERIGCNLSSQTALVFARPVRGTLKAGRTIGAGLFAA
jgi:hypothetical protein